AFEEVVDGDDVGMGQRTRDARLAYKALDERLVGGSERVELLERDPPIELGIVGEVHDRHPAPAHFAKHLVAHAPGYRGARNEGSDAPTSGSCNALDCARPG